MDKAHAPLLVWKSRKATYFFQDFGHSQNYLVVHEEIVWELRVKGPFKASCWWLSTTIPFLVESPVRNSIFAIQCCQHLVASLKEDLLCDHLDTEGVFLKNRAFSCFLSTPQFWKWYSSALLSFSLRLTRENTRQASKCSLRTPYLVVDQTLLSAEYKPSFLPILDHLPLFVHVPLVRKLTTEQ